MPRGTRSGAFEPPAWGWVDRRTCPSLTCSWMVLRWPRLASKRRPFDAGRDAACSLAVAKLPWTDPVNSAEPAREVRRIGPAHRRSDRRHGVVRSRQHDGCTFRTNLGEIVHGRHPERSGEAASEVGGADVGLPAQLRERPGECDVILDQRHALSRRMTGVAWMRRRHRRHVPRSRPRRVPAAGVRPAPREYAPAAHRGRSARARRETIWSGRRRAGRSRSRDPACCWAAAVGRTGRGDDRRGTPIAALRPRDRPGTGSCRRGCPRTAGIHVRRRAERRSPSRVPRARSRDR